MKTLKESEAIIREHQDAAPVKVVPIAEEFGVSVFSVKGWKDDLSGMIRKDAEDGGSSGFAIYVNAAHHPNRRRFTIAHELAHFIMHGEIIGDGIVDDALYRSGMSNKIEQQANKYAAEEILMPQHLLSPALDDTKNVEQLAQRFQVSEMAMSIRLGLPV